MRQMTVAVLLAAFTVGCATTTGPKFDTTKPLRIEEGAFRQDGQALQVSDIEEQFEKHPYTRTRLDGYQAKKWTGAILGYVGGALVGWNVSDNLLRSGDGTTKSWTPSLVGAGAVALSIPFALLAKTQMDAAVESYNKSLSMTGSVVLESAVPFIAVVPQRQGGNQCLAGVTLSF